jgi:type IV secretion system protein TrbL
MEFNTLTATLTNFIGAFQGGYTRLQPMINGLLAALAGIDIVLVGFWWALGGGERLTEVMKKVLFLGFWLWFTRSFQNNAKMFVDSLISAGLTAGGQAGGNNLLLDPSKIAAYGLTTTEALSKAMGGISITHPADALVYGICYVVIMAAFLIMAIQVFLAVLEYYLITAVAGVLVPWGLLPHTKFLAEKAIGAVVSAGIKLMVLAFIIAVASPVLSSMRFTSEEIKLNELWSAVLTSSAIAFLAWHAPSLAAGLLAGSPSLGAGAIAQNVSSGAMIVAGVAGGMVAMTRSAANGAAALGSRAAGAASGGAGAGGATGGAAGTGGPVSALHGAGKGSPSAIGRSAGGAPAAGVSRAGEAAQKAVNGSGEGRSSVPGSASPPPWAVEARASLHRDGPNAPVT